MEYKNLIDEIVDLEWNFFQNVQNEGGRASCQEDPETFGIMRRSQFLTWPEEICRMYFRDLIRAQMEERNPITEKYARMMASTDPVRYRQIEPWLPAVSKEKCALVESIISVHKKWMTEHAERYPGLSGRGRYLFTGQDTPWETSSETYLRGELLTYSEETLTALLAHTKDMDALGINPVTEQDRNQVLAYGYKDLDEAEERIRRS